MCVQNMKNDTNMWWMSTSMDKSETFSEMNENTNAYSYERVNLTVFMRNGVRNMCDKSESKLFERLPSTWAGKWNV